MPGSHDLHLQAHMTCISNQPGSGGRACTSCPVYLALELGVLAGQQGRQVGDSASVHYLQERHLC